MQCRVAFACLIVAFAAVPVVVAQPFPSAISPFYDDFNHRWLDPAKWQVGPNCWTSGLECVREIEDGKLRLALRSFGARDSSSGVQMSDSSLPFPQGLATSITSIRTDVSVRAHGGTSCPANPDLGNAQAQIGGNFFNKGSGSGQDVYAYLKVLSLPNSQTMNIILSWGAIDGQGPGDWAPVATYPVGTPLVMTLRWDQANHQFLAAVRAKGEAGQGSQVISPYNPLDVPDGLPPALPWKTISVSAWPANCESALTTSYIEATFDNVIVNH
jgi:hypothetical protein